MNAGNQEHPAILLVDTRSASLRRLSDTLHRAGHVVIEAASFDDAKHALADYRPGVLISALRLAAFNGLHLVHLGRLLNPDLNAIIVSTDRDVLLHDEVHLVGATLLIEPLHIPALLTLLGNRPEASGATPEGMPFIERRVRDRRQTPDRGHLPERRMSERRVSDGQTPDFCRLVRVRV